MTRGPRTRVEAVALIVSALIAAGCGIGKAPAEQAPVVSLTTRTIETFRLQFNQAANETRVVLLLSPT